MKLTEPMVDRLFWRAGFGPSAADRRRWKGKPVLALVDWFLTAPARLVGPAPTKDGMALDPIKNDDDLVLEWVDRMIRTTNPLVERLTFFYHRHLANSQQGVGSNQMLRTQNAVFRGYADLAHNPNASFRGLMRDITIDPAMLRFLNGESNVKGAPNENYARELMELFCLGVRDDRNRANYTQYDVEQLAKALTGWSIAGTDGMDPHPTPTFNLDSWNNGPKVVFGVQQEFRVRERTDPGYVSAKDPIELVLRRPGAGRKPYETHARFFLRKLWHEFIVPAPDARTMNALVAAYLAPVHGVPGLHLKPVLRRILSAKALFSSLAEPDMVKPPVVYVVGMFRSLGAHVTDNLAYRALSLTDQVPYEPPNVAGWEGGNAWLTTNSVLWRFSLAGELLRRLPPVDHVESATMAVKRAVTELHRPWVAKATMAIVNDAASRSPSGSADARIQRQRLVRALLLAGPDGQVM